MIWASLARNRLVVNLGREHALHLRGYPRRTCTSDMCVRIAALHVDTYPDLAVTCDDPEFVCTKADTVLNPTLISEEPSGSIERDDRGKKFALYRSLPSLGE